MNMHEQLQQIQQELQDQLRQIQDSGALEALRLKVLGKKGSLTQMLRSMGQLSAEERPAMGQLINRAREEMSARLDEVARRIQEAEKEARLRAEALDVTLPSSATHQGCMHPISMVIDQVTDVLTGMGFEVVEGPEIELDHYNFELMNIPKNHPSRDAQDTFCFDENMLLRTHT